MDKRIKDVIKRYKKYIKDIGYDETVEVDLIDFKDLISGFKEAVKQRDDLLETVIDECFHRCDDSAEVMGVADISKLTREVLNRTLLERFSSAKKTID